jgi:hypothetical protein
VIVDFSLAIEIAICVILGIGLIVVLLLYNRYKYRFFQFLIIIKKRFIEFIKENQAMMSRKKWNFYQHQ